VQVTGIVQGVGFRPFVYRLAVEYDLVGYVLNRGDAGVEIVAEGPKDPILRFIDDFKQRAPPLAAIDTVVVSWQEEDGFEIFSIQPSSAKRSSIPSIVPPDVSICEECKGEMACPNDRRYQYFFTTCTNCGPRYTTITGLPYDRPTTTMDVFPLCEECRTEYTDPVNRRYHAQTIACPTCGPQVYLRDGRGTILRMGVDALLEAGSLLESGAVMAVKGNGGYHLVCSAFCPSAIGRLRRLLLRPHQPFAVMAKDMAMVRKLVTVHDQDVQLLTSSAKPIVVMEKKANFDDVAPGLHTVGIMLPYTGLHVLLFERCSQPLVMTSANTPGEPIIYQEKTILEAHGSKIDFFVTYNRHIAHRCDDSVVRVVANQALFIRRSRGYAPMPISFPPVDKNIVAVGAELGVTACIAIGDKAFLSPYIGNTSKPDTLRFLETETRHLVSLTNMVPDVVAHDLHPAFTTTGFAVQLAEEFGAMLEPVQHHHAHLAKVLGEHDIEEAVGIAIDGIGYGDDGSLWGGEVMHCTPAEYTRVGHLESHPLVGGDRATRYPLRIAAGILASEADLEPYLHRHDHIFPYGAEEVDIVLHQARQRVGIPTTSCGRVLDAAAALLAICFERTYEGEPAMRLESHARSGTAEALPVLIVDKNPAVVQTTPLFQYLWEHRKGNSHDLAATVERYIAHGLAQVAIEHAEREHVKAIALAGGCAYNEHITSVIRSAVDAAGLNLVRNQKLPSGDGGISYGQAVVAGALHSH